MAAYVWRWCDGDNPRETNSGGAAARKIGGGKANKFRDPQNPSAWTFHRLWSHGPVAAAAWMRETETLDISEYVYTGRADQYGIAVGDLLTQGKDSESRKEALGAIGGDSCLAAGAEANENPS